MKLKLIVLVLIVLLFVIFNILKTFAVVFIIWQGIELVKIGPENGGINSESFFQFIMMTVMIGASIGSVPDLLSKIQEIVPRHMYLIDGANKTHTFKTSEFLDYFLYLGIY